MRNLPIHPAAIVLLIFSVCIGTYAYVRYQNEKDVYGQQLENPKLPELVKAGEEKSGGIESELDSILLEFEKKANRYAGTPGKKDTGTIIWEDVPDSPN